MSPSLFLSPCVWHLLYRCFVILLDFLLATASSVTVVFMGLWFAMGTDLAPVPSKLSVLKPNNYPVHTCQRDHLPLHRPYKVWAGFEAGVSLWSTQPWPWGRAGLLPS